MATSRGFRQFERRMKIVGEFTAKNAERIVRKAALTMDQVTVTMTPVDTGRARANWVTSVGFPVLQNLDPSAAPDPLAQGAAIIKEWKLGLPAIYISNGVPYIEQLDNGSSQQAPQGMLSAALLAGETVVRSEGKLLRGL